MSKFCIDTFNYLDKRVVFDEKNRSKHIIKRPQLNDSKFISKVKTTIEKPHYVYESLNNPSKIHTYYRLESYKNTRWGRINLYTAVVVLIAYNPFRVMTTYQTDSIREEGQTKCLWENPQN